METRFSNQLDHIRRPAGFTFQNRNAHSGCLEAWDKRAAAAERKKEQELGLPGLALALAYQRYRCGFVTHVTGLVLGRVERMAL
jgi:hypothetical protein